LRKSISVGRVSKSGTVYSVTVGTNLVYAKYVHDGTGIYGPLKRPIIILPTNKKALYWKGAKHPVRKVIQKGIRPNTFLSRAAKGVEGELTSLLSGVASQAIVESIGNAFKNMQVEIKA
jgi:hypothetical protein